MNRIIGLMIVFLFLFATAVWASPFLVSDPSASAVGTQYEIWSNTKGLPEEMIAVSGKLIISANNELDGSIRYDLKDIAPGECNWYIRYAQSWGYYGESKTEAGGKSYSIFVPFNFTKRATASGSIKGLKLAP